MNHHRPCSNIKEKMRKIYRVIFSDMLMDCWCGKFCRKIISSSKILFWDIQRLSILRFNFLVKLPTNNQFCKHHAMSFWDTICYCLYQESLMLFSAYSIHFLMKKKVWVKLISLYTTFLNRLLLKKLGRLLWSTILFLKFICLLEWKLSVFTSFETPE